MSSLVSRAREARKSAHFTRIVKFASVSVIATLVTQAVLFLSYHEAKIGSAMECNVLATAVATVPAYYLNRTWTWGKRGKSHLWREVAPFWVIAFIGLVLSTVAVGVAAHNADHVTSSPDVRVAVIMFANLATYGVIWFGRYFIFNRYLFGEHTQPANAIPVGATVSDATASAPVNEHDEAELAALSGNMDRLHDASVREAVDHPGKQRAGLADER